MDFFDSLLEEQYGFDLASKVKDGLSQDRVLSFRVNRIKSNRDEIESVLNDNQIEFQGVSWYKDAFIVDNKEKEKIQGLDIYNEGKIYFQSLSSMIPPLVLDPKEGENILDMAAAPGSKTTQIAAICDNKCFITACEKNKIRADRLKYNIEKQGVKNTYVMSVDSRNLDDMFSFDKILLDAPCSGSGTININDENLNKKFNQELIERSSKLQVTLLNKAINLLKPGHEMIYSTCSILKKENEEIIERVLKTGKVELVPIELGKEVPRLPVKIDGTICVMPNKYYEGFFVAKLRKI
ncbi:MAG: RsmB/NOP family class I SAM-dependent RNA methyltransferase [Clostridia bacterium]|nr:RsmB/NOP family class I SAM-dependent RNA methyltransferase [Clostridia bacterium]